MNLYSIQAGNFKLDGGAMFGVVPKSLWQKTNPADSDNMIDMSARCMLIEDGDKLILVDTGMGNKQSEKFFNHYKRWGNFDLVKSINTAGFGVDEITDVLLTHLHFDHCGGAVFWDNAKERYDVQFKNANYWSNENHWNWATKPNPREKASFLDENLLPIKESGRLSFLKNTSNEFVFSEELGIEVLCVDGHTEKQMIPKVNLKGKDLIYCADLIPTAGHIPVPYIMGYDVRPLLTMKEKSIFLEDAFEKDCLLFMEHDPNNEIVSLKKTEKGIRFDKSFLLEEL
jgi:glyoxylase-like metal-dependent hydrolase (beta-lactamase superfamily II)